MKKIIACLLLAATAAVAQVNPVLYTTGNTIKVDMPDGGSVLSIEPMFWGPDWAWTGVGGSFTLDNGVARSHITGTFGGTGVGFDGHINITAETPRRIRVDGDFRVLADTDLTVAALGLSTGPDFQGAGRLTVVNGAGGETVHPMPPAFFSIGNAKQLRIRNAAGDAIVVTYDIAQDTPCDGAIRWPLAITHMNASEPRDWWFTVEFPFDVESVLVPSEVPLPADIARYFAWTASGNTDPSVIGAESLLDAPAGRHGRITRVADTFVYNGAPIKLWGLNTCYNSVAPDQATAERRAAFYAKYGVNAVRLHKFADGTGWAGVLSSTSAVAYDESPNAAPAMDYYVACLKAKGIYVKLSANFGNVKIGPADRVRVSIANQLGSPGGDGWQNGNHAALWLSNEIQDLQMDQLCNMLRRTNTTTNIRYADDPAVFMVELANENCAFFYNIWGDANSIPVLKQMAGEQFRDWLHAKYGTEAAMLAAWGATNYNGVPDQGTQGESWNGAIYPAGNPWYWDNLANDPRWPRLVDAALFWFDRQNAFYDRFVDEIRATGYDGEIIASNWQAGAGIAHYLNLLSDRGVGTIDRHNYHAATWSMFQNPGSGIVSVGPVTQMEDRPYMLSEWIHEAKPFGGDPASPRPFDIASEGPVIFSAYGMGLNGWDASFMFENADPGNFKHVIADTWDVVLPNIIGLFPAVARSVHRGDIRESGLVFARNIDLASLEEGVLGLDDTLDSTAYDVRAFSSDMLPETLMAIGRMVVRLNETPVPTDTVDPAQFLEDGRYFSSTRQLAWRPGANPRDGHIEINTPSTQAQAGFAGGRTAVLADVDIRTDNPYAVIYVTSLNNARPIATARNVLVTALARIRNTGQKVLAGSTLDWGTAPILMEPVTAEITIKRPGAFIVHVLDQDGRRTGNTLLVEGRVVSFDTADDRTLYYEIEFEPNPATLFMIR
jgi:hypothetical protein